MLRRSLTATSSRLSARRPLRLVVALAAAASPAWAGAECVSMQAGELRLSNASGCPAQLRDDPTVRRAAVRHIHAGLAGGPVVLASAVGAAARSGRSDNHGLSHPLARLSALNAQSRYLWSLGNPAPTYYGQTATP